MAPSLNQAQLEAVHYIYGPSLVLAGAGSGKTRVITHKIGHLLQAGIRPEQITAITFTNKAAAEMRERAKALLGKPAKHIVISTFHSLGVRILRESGSVVGLKPHFSILDTGDVTHLLKDAGGTTDTLTAKKWQYQISQWKGEGWDGNQALTQAKNEEELQIARVMLRYEERLSAYQSVDFDDLINLPLSLLRHHTEVREHWQRSIAHALVDEYQDTNASQYELLKLLVGERAHFTAVGDDDQSIYGWRGATLDNLRRLPQDYPQLRVIKLEQNYRSTSAILRAANNVITLNPKLFPKTLFSELGEGEPVKLIEAESEEQEAERVVSRIQALRSAGDGNGKRAEFRDFAVLYRANHLARPIEVALRRASIPYKVSGGQSFFERSEIRDLCAWFRLWSNEDDDPAFVRAITTPKRGIGHQTLAALGQFASQYKLSLFAALFSSSLSSVLSAKALDGLHEFGRYVTHCQEDARAATDAKAANEFLMQWLETIRYRQYLIDSEDSAKVAESKWESVLDFVQWLCKRCEPEPDEPGNNRTMLEVAQSMALLSTISEKEKDRDVVNLSTLHASKGLEWPHVMLVGVNEGTLPFYNEADGGNRQNTDQAEIPDSSPAEADATRLEEERRLMYVGITRAQRTLTVLWTRRRKKGRDFVSVLPSRFIAEMKLDETQSREDPREKLRALRAEFAARAAAQSSADKPLDT
ncbi:UvrD-helicase domain-containing protein [Curvibacter sp. CHRR-16]|nr:UvrD-helicase domain-containing protein [Curvibacter sp. CHRR-16]